jgi:hypothetical protein
MERGANMTRQIPMLFSPAMVEALLAGRKTETRRILNPQPETYQNDAGETCDIHPFKVEGQTRSRIASGFGGSGVITTQECRAEIGDLIWVKEAHYAFGWWQTTDELTKKTQKPKRQFVRSPAKPVLFEAPDDVMTGQPEQRSGWYKRSSLFLPKQESRLTLRVTGFSIELLHQISNTGAVDEGCDVKATDPILGTPLTFGGFNEYVTALEWYRRLWNTINGPEAWDANPWVDVKKFDVLHQNVQGVAA